MKQRIKKSYQPNKNKFKKLKLIKFKINWKTNFNPFKNVFAQKYLCAKATLRAYLTSTPLFYYFMNIQSMQKRQRRTLTLGKVFFLSPLLSVQKDKLDNVLINKLYKIN